MKISVIIPIYNVSDYIEDCLKSVINQDFLDFECLLVDDCSTDKSLIITEEFVSKYDGPIEFRIIKKNKNEGLSEARNTGISLSKGDYLYFLDSDDEISKDALSYLISKAILFNYDMVSAEFVNTWDEVNVKQDIVEEAFYNEDVSYFINRKISGWNKLIKKSLIDEYSLYFEPGIYHEDRLWNFLVTLKLKSVFLSNKITYIYRIRPNSIITDQTKLEKRIDDSVFIINKMVEAIRKQSLSNFQEKFFMNYVESSRYSTCIFSFSLSEQKAKKVYNILDPKYSLDSFFFLSISNIIKNACWLFSEKYGFNYMKFFFNNKYSK